MRFAGRFIIGLACGLGLAAVFPAKAATEAGGPYTTIVTRNIFGLLPMPTNNPADSLPPPEPPPKITPNGIMSIFGKLQVLFKVAVKPPPGQPAKDASYVMCEGERQDEITVVKIDEKAGVVTFDNHGTPQELPLIVAPASSGGPGPGGPGMIPGGLPPGGAGLGTVGRNPFNPPPGAMGRFGGGGNPGGGVNPSTDGASPFSAMPTPGGMNRPNSAPQQPQEQLSAAEQMILMEAQRAQMLDAGNPAHIIFPPTPLTPQLMQPDEPGGTGPKHGP